MLSKPGATRLRKLYRSEMEQLAPAAPPAALAAPAAPPAAHGVPNFALEPLLEAEGYTPFPHAYRPKWREVKEVKTAIQRTKVPIPWISPKLPVFISRDWDPKAAASANAAGLLEAYAPAVAELGGTDPNAAFTHITIAKASAAHNADQRVAVWLAATTRIVHAMVPAGCFGPAGQMWVAACYLQVLGDISTRFSFRAAVLYDQAIREMGEESPHWGANQALPYYVGLHKETLADVKLRRPSAFTPPRAASSPPLEAPAASSSSETPAKRPWDHRGNNPQQQQQQPPRAGGAAAGSIQPYSYASPAPKPPPKRAW